MKRMIFSCFLLIVLLLFASCSNSNRKIDSIETFREDNAVENSEIEISDDIESSQSTKTEGEESNAKEPLNDSTDINNSIFLVKFNLDGGNKFITYNYKEPTAYSYSLIVKNGETYASASPNKKMPAASRSGYLFKGWYTRKNGLGQKITDSTKVELKNNIEVFAYWKESINLNYDCVNSFACSSGTFGVVKGFSVLDFKNDSSANWIVYIEGYEFNGFYKNENCDEKYLDNYVWQNGDMVYLKHTALIHNFYVRPIGNGQVEAEADTISTDGSVKVIMSPDDGYVPVKTKRCHGSYDSQSGCQENGITWLDNNYETTFNYTEASGEGDFYVTITFEKK